MREATHSTGPSFNLASVLVVGTILFNPFLAIINAHVMTLNNMSVGGCEAILDAGALIAGLQSQNTRKGTWFCVVALILLINVTNMMGNLNFDPKFPRDVLIIPLFVLAGLTSNRASILRIILALQAIVLAFAIFEAVSPDQFGRLFDVTLYYINTRGFQAGDFWSKETTDLFVSATRPDARFLFPMLNIHRLSSVFLEPVSLGNYCVIIAMIVAALWERIAPLSRWFLILSTFVILVGCDGRFAVTSIVLLILMRFIVPSLPLYSNVLYLPGFLAASALAVLIFNFPATGDDFPSRVAGSINVLSNMSWIDLFGYDAAHAYDVMDSGISYLVQSQSIIGAAAVWIVISCGLPQNDRASVVFAHLVSIYVSLNLLISYSVFSIKTAGLLWFALGAIADHPQTRRLLARAVAPKAPLLQPAGPI